MMIDPSQELILVQDICFPWCSQPKLIFGETIRKLGVISCGNCGGHTDEFPQESWARFKNTKIPV